MKWSNILVFALIQVLFIQCDEPTTTSTLSTVDSTESVASQINQPRPKSVEKPIVDIAAIERKGQTMTVSTFNQSVVKGLANKEAWVESPILVALQFCGDDMECRKKTIELESTQGAESFDELRVVITEEGLLDDSLKGSMFILQLVKNNGLWQIKKATQAWNCWTGRGHQDYSAEPCN